MPNLFAFLIKLSLFNSDIWGTRYFKIMAEGVGFAHKSTLLLSRRSRAAPRGLARQHASRDIAAVFSPSTRRKQFARSLRASPTNVGATRRGRDSSSLRLGSWALHTECSHLLAFYSRPSNPYPQLKIPPPLLLPEISEHLPDPRNRRIKSATSRPFFF